MWKTDLISTKLSRHPKTMNIIDLHVHSLVSDGSYSPRELAHHAGHYARRVAHPDRRRAEKTPRVAASRRTRIIAMNRAAEDRVWRTAVDATEPMGAGRLPSGRAGTHRMR